MGSLCQMFYHSMVGQQSVQSPEDVDREPHAGSWIFKNFYSNNFCKIDEIGMHRMAIKVENLKINS